MLNPFTVSGVVLYIPMCITYFAKGVVAGVPGDYRTILTFDFACDLRLGSKSRLLQSFEAEIETCTSENIQSKMEQCVRQFDWARTRGPVQLFSHEIVTHNNGSGVWLACSKKKQKNPAI